MAEGQLAMWQVAEGQLATWQVAEGRASWAPSSRGRHSVIVNYSIVLVLLIGFAEEVADRGVGALVLVAPLPVRRAARAAHHLCVLRYIERVSEIYL